MRYYKEIIIAIVAIISLILLTAVHIIRHRPQIVEVPVETVRVEYVDKSERDNDEYGCPENAGEYVDHDEYIQCEKVKQEQYLAHWKRDTRMLESILDSTPRLPLCALTLWHDIACMEEAGRTVDGVRIIVLPGREGI